MPVDIHPLHTPLTRLQQVYQRFQQAPHRAYFSAGVMAVMMLAAWWLRMLSVPSHAAYPTVLVHALLMPLGVFPLFMLGFIFTAGPKWLGVADTGRHIPLAGLYLAGILLALLGFSKGGRWPVFGLLFMQIVWSVATLRWLAYIRKSTAADQRHARRLLIAMAMGAVTLMMALLWVDSGGEALWAVARNCALWGMLLPIFLTVSHRMIPFFTQSALLNRPAWRPFWLLDLGLIGCGALVLTGVMAWAYAQAAIATLMALGLMYTSWRWGLWASLSNRLLAMLHLSFAWLGPALGLQALAALNVPIGAAPAHALGLGFCGTMLVGFVTRVSLGHSGQPLVADRGYWAIYLGLHLVALLRVTAAVLGAGAAWLFVISALWLVLMLAWAARVLPLYFRARADGKPA